MWTVSASNVKIPLDCVPQTWYLSDDFRTLMVLPVFIYLLALNTYLGYSTILGTYAFCVMRMISALRQANVDYTLLLTWQPHIYSLMADRLHHVYTDFFVRLGTNLMGVVVGHLLYLYENGRIPEPPRWVRSIIPKMALIIGIILFFAGRFIANPYINQFLPSAESMTSDSVLLLVPGFKSIMEFCLSIMLLNLITGGGFKAINALLANKMMKFLCSISYAVFLCHIEVMYKAPLMRFDTTVPEHLAVYAISFIVVSHMVALVVHLLYEMPLNNLMREALKMVYKFMD